MERKKLNREIGHRHYMCVSPLNAALLIEEFNILRYSMCVYIK